MRPSSVFVLVLVLAAAVVAALVASIPAGDSAAAEGDAAAAPFWGHADAGHLRDAYWYDGKAEVNRYRAVRVMYGEPRETDEVVHVVVSEKHDPELLVKADDWRRPGLVDVLKFNYVTSVETGIYTYHQMFSFFFTQDDAHLAKMTLASHEWCGNTFKELINFRGRGELDFNTYWDGQGDGRYEADFPPGLVVYDALPVQLRALDFAVGLETGLDLLPSQLSSKVSGPPQWHRATVTVGERSEVTVPLGTFDAWPVTLRHAGGTDRFAFEADFPHRMLRWRAASGDEQALLRSAKLAYWQMNGPEHDDAI